MSGDRTQQLHPSTADYLGQEHKQLKAYVENNLTPTQVSQVSEAYGALAKMFGEFGQHLGSALSKTSGEWEGGAGAGAQGYFVTLARWADANAQNAKLAGDVLAQQSASAVAVKNKMPDEVPFNWADEFQKWTHATPFELADAVKGAFGRQQRSQDAHSEAATVMQQYDTELYQAASKQPAFAPPPKFDTPTSAAAAPAPGGPAVGLGDGPGSSGSSGSSGGGASGGGAPAPAPAPPPQLSAGGQSGATAMPHQGLPTGATTAAAAQHGGFGPTPQAAGNQGGGMPMGAMPMGAMGAGMGGSGDNEYTSKIGKGDFGPGGGGPARPGGLGAAETVSGAGMGTFRDEPERGGSSSYLLAGDDDEVFGNDEMTAPPVIGE